MESLIFELQLFADTPGDPPSGGGGDNPGGGSSSSTPSWSGVTVYTQATVASAQSYTSSTADENAVLISTTATVTLNDATVTKSGGTSSDDAYSFYGINSAVMCMGGGTTSIVGGTVTTDAAGANGIFSYGANSGQTNATGDGTTVYVKDVEITTTAQGSGGIMTTYGGTTYASDLTITTSGGSSAPIRTDRGGGWVYVNGGTYTSNGLGSPAIYSTADVNVSDATLTSTQSEGVCIEGAGSIALSNCNLTATNSNTNGDAKFYDTIMIYQSMSGDASKGTSVFTMTGGSLTSNNGHVFHVTNTSATINLNGVTINNNDSNGVLLSVCDDGWSGNDNVATFNATDQTLTGTILVGDDSTLNLNLSGSSTFTGNLSGSITNAKNSTVSTSIGTVNVTLADDAKWYLTEDTYVSSFTGEAANVINNGFKLYENGNVVDGTTDSEDNGTIAAGESLVIGGIKYTAIEDAVLQTSNDAVTGITSGKVVATIDGATTTPNVTIDGSTAFTFESTLDSETYVNSSNIHFEFADSSFHYVSGDVTYTADSITFDTGTLVLATTGLYSTLMGYLNINLSNSLTVPVSGGVMSFNFPNETTATLSEGIANGSMSFQGEAEYNRTNKTLALTKDAHFNIDASATVLTLSLKLDFDLVAATDTTLAFDDGKFIIQDGGSVTITGDTFPSNGTFAVSGGNLSFDYESALSTGTSFGKVTTLTLDKNATLTFTPSGDTNTVTVTGDNSNDAVITMQADRFLVTSGSDSYEVLFSGSGDTGLNINNTDTAIALTGTEYADTINNSGENVTIDAAGGTDSITNGTSASNVSISSGAGNDTINNSGGYATIDAGEGDDSITNNNLGRYTIIDAGAGNDSITNATNGRYVTINGGDDDDYISNSAQNVSITGGAGNDSIYSSNSSNTIDAGAGNNFISISGGSSNLIISSGNDTIDGYSSTSNTIQVEFSDSTVEGDDVILTTSNGTLTILDAKGDTLNINGTETVFGGETETTNTLATYLADFMLYKTEAGYPAMATVAFHPTEPNPDAPTNYYSSETWTATSADDLTLSAVHYSPENPTGKWVILVHGYGKIGAAMNGFADPYLAQGLDVLIVDQRAAGNSAGEWLTMGVAESADLAVWTQEIAKTNSNAQITLHGVSMGAATVMLAAALAETTNVTSMIEDCGYSNISDVLVGLLTAYGSALGVTGDPAEIAEEVFKAGESLTGYNVADAVPESVIAQVTVPSLFIHGNADEAIPVSNAQTLYNESGSSDKTLVTIEGAGHAKSAEVDSVTYLNAAMTLINNSTSEIGASINSTVDNKNVRGTIYDDTITASGDNVTIDSGAGNDSIRVIEADKISINAGDGDNYVFNAFAYYDEDGNFVSKYTFDENGNLVSRTNKNSKQSTAATILGGNGNDTLVNQGIDNATVDAGEGNNFIGLYHSYYNTITTGSGNDSVAVDKGHYVNVSTGAGDDSIIGRIGTIEEDSWAFGGYATIDAGAGNDYIAPIYSNNSSIYGGDGDDTIINNGKNTTINGGAGNDYIELTNNYEGTTKDYEPQTIIASAGNDTISGYTSTAAIIGDFTSNELDGEDVIFTNGENTVKILDAKGKIIKLLDSNGNSNSTIIGGDGSMAIEKIENGNTFESNGVIYTAVDGDAELNVESGVVTGITSGKVEATIKDAATTPTITFDGTTAFDFSADGSEANGLHVQIGESSVTYASGKATYDATTISYPEGEVQFKLTNALSAALFGNIAVTVPASGVTVPNGSDGTNIFWDVLEDGVTISLTGGMVSGSVEASGEISYDAENKVISLGEGASVKGTNIGVAPDVTNFEITALNATTVNIEGSGIGANVVFKDGASIHVSGESFGISAGLATSGSDLSFPFASLLTQGGLSSISLEQNSTLTVTPDDSVAIAITTAEDDTTALASFADNKIKVSTINEKGVTLALAGSTEENLNVVGTVTVDIATAEFTFANNAVVTSTIQSLPIKYVLETAGDYTLNGNQITTTADNVEISFENENTISFDAGAAVTVAGATYEAATGNKVQVTSGEVSLVMYNPGDATLDGQKFTLTEESTDGVKIAKTTDGGFEVGAATLSVNGDDDYSVKLNKTGIEEIDGVSNNANVKVISEEGIEGVKVVTETAEKVSFGSNEYSIANDDAVTLTADFDKDGNGTVSEVADLNGTFEGKVTDTIKVNDAEITVSEESNLTVLADDTSILLSGVAEGAEVTFDADNVEVLVTGETKVNGVTYKVEGDSDGVTVGKDGVTGLAKDAKLTITPAGTYKVNDTSLEVEEGKTVVGTDSGAEILSNDTTLMTGEEKTVNGVTYKLEGEDADGVIISEDNKVTGLDKDGKITITNAGETVSINDTEITLENGNSLAVSSDGEKLTVSDVTEGAEVTFDADNVGVLVTGETTVNGVTYTVEDDADGVTVGKDGVTGLAKDAKLTITPAGTYKVNDTSLDVEEDQTIIGTDDGAEILLGDTILLTGEEKTVNGVTYKLEGNDSDGVVISKDNEVTGLDKDGKLTITNAGETVSINETEIKVTEGSELTVASDGEKLTVSDVTEGAEVSFDADNVEVEVTGETTVNDVTYKVESDSDGVTVSKDGVTSLDKNAKLTITPAGTYNVNGTSLVVKDGDTVIGVTDDYAYIKDANTPDFTSDTTTEEILDKLGIDEDKVTEMTDQEDVALDNVKNNAVVVKEEATGDKTVALGNKGSAAIVEDTDAPVTIAGGKGKDTLVSQGENVTFDMTAGGKDEIIATGGNITLENYDPTSNAGIQVTPEDLEAGVKLGDDKVKLANAEVNIGDTADNFVNLFMPDGKEVKVGFATENDNNVNASLSNSNMVLIGGGSYRGVSLEGDVINSELRGGNGNDSIYGGESAYIDAGAGKNYVEMSDKGGSTLNFSQGKTTVDNFNFVGEDATADTVQMGSVILSSVKVADGDVILETANGNVRIKDAENKAIAFNNNYTDGDINLVVAKDELEVKDNGYYVAAGKNAAVDISGYTGETANVNLGYSDYNDTDNLSFNGDVKDVNAKGFAGEATITGNDKNNAITASDGGSTIYGGAGKDTFTGGAGADEFVVGTGRKLIKDFDTDEDKVNVESAILQKVSAKDDNIIYTTENGTVTIEGAAGKMVEFENQYTDGSIQIQVADDEINVKENGYYLASGKNATVSLADYAESSAVANLADQNFLNKDGLSFYGDIKELDATGYTGEAVLYGNSGNNIITAGSGNSSLWGGEGGNDTLIGGDGEDTFFYVKGNGKDVVQGATDNDLVILSGISLSDLTATGEDIFSGNDLKFSVNDGGSLTVKNGKTSGVAVEIEGTQYYVDNGEWQTK